MDKYISRQETISVLDYMLAKSNDIGETAALIMVKTHIKQIPAADVRLVRRGNWKHVAGMNSKCSECERYFPVQEFESRPFDINFCPHCGARMNGGAENG